MISGGECLPDAPHSNSHHRGLLLEYRCARLTPVHRHGWSRVLCTDMPKHGFCICRGTMKAVTWHGKRDVRVETVPDPRIEDPADAIIRITSTAICGSDLHLYELLGPFLEKGDILGHEPMGIVEEVGPAVSSIQPGDRVVVPFNIACGHCWMCERQLFAQCETTQVRQQGMGAALFGYTKLYGQVPGGQAEYLRVPQAQFGPIKVPEGPPDERFLFLSDVLPTAWQAVTYANNPEGGSAAIFGLAPATSIDGCVEGGGRRTISVSDGDRGHHARGPVRNAKVRVSARCIKRVLERRAGGNIPRVPRFYT